MVKAHSKVLAERRAAAKEKIKAAATASAMEVELQSQAAVDAFSQETSRKTSGDDGDSNEQAKSMIDGTVFRFLERAPEDRCNDGDIRGCLIIHDEDLLMF